MIRFFCEPLWQRSTKNLNLAGVNAKHPVWWCFASSVRRQTAWGDHIRRLRERATRR